MLKEIEYVNKFIFKIIFLTIKYMKGEPEIQIFNRLAQFKIRKLYFPLSYLKKYKVLPNNLYEVENFVTSFLVLLPNITNRQMIVCCLKLLDRFDLARLCLAVLQFDTVHRHLSVIFGTKVKKRTREIPALAYYVTARSNSKIVIVYLVFNFKNVQPILE